MLSLNFEDFLLSVDRLDPAKTLLVFVAEQSQAEVPKILSLLSKEGFTVAGAVFPRILFEQESYQRGFLILEVDPGIEPLLIENVDHGNYGFEDLPLGARCKQGGAILVLVDSACSSQTDFLGRLYQHFGESWNYVGGGAGNHESAPAPCVFTGTTGLKSGAAVIIFIEGKASIGARHGWSRAIGPFIATKSDGNLLQEIDWRPAMEVYSEVIASTVNEVVTEESIRTHGLAHPLGMIKQGAEDVVRVPIAVDDGALVVIGGVPQNSVFHILGGNSTEVIRAAFETAISCAKHLDQKANLKIVFDCVSRREFLDSDFTKELDAIKTGLEPLGDSPLVGVLSRGEIASSTGGRPNWLNKTAVIGVFE